MVNGFGVFNGVTLTATFSVTTVPQLSPGVPATGISGAAGSQQFFSLTVPPGKNAVTFSLSGGAGDVDLFMRNGAEPTPTTFACRPFVNGNNETCTLSLPAAGNCFAMIRGFTAFTGVTLLGRIP